MENQIQKIVSLPLDVEDVLKYVPDRFNQDEKAAIQNAVLNMSSGVLFTFLLECKAEKCVYGVSCPFYSTKKFPKGEKCPMERALAEKWTREYMEQFDVSFRDRTDVTMIQTLVEIDVEIMRAKAELSSEGFKEVVVTETERSKTFSKKLNELIIAVEKWHEKRMRILKALNATRESGMKKVTDPSVLAAKMKQRLEKKMRGG